MAATLTPVPPAEAIAALRARGRNLTPSFAWQDVWQQEHQRAFTVAKSAGFDILKDIHDALLQALSEGQTFESFARNLRPTLEAKGWWGRSSQMDPLTGEVKPVQLGSTRRLQTIFSVNMRVSYAQGHWAQFERTKATRPYLRYVAVLDGRTRPEHAARHNVCALVDDPFWDRWAPPCGWNCRCTLQSLSKSDLARLGTKAKNPPPDQLVKWTNRRTGEVTEVPKGIDPGWGYNPGKIADSTAKATTDFAKKLDGSDAPEALIKAARDYIAQQEKIAEAIAAAGKAAETEVRDRGLKTGHEHLVAIDEVTGERVAYHTDRRTGAVSIPDALFAKLRDPNRMIALYHNHPSSSSLSGADIRVLANSGVSTIVAIGHDQARWAVRRGTRQLDTNSYIQAVELAGLACRQAIVPRVASGSINGLQGLVLEGYMRLMLLHRLDLVVAVAEPGPTWYTLIESNRPWIDQVLTRLANAMGPKL